MIFSLTTDPDVITFGIAMILACFVAFLPGNEK